MYDAEIEALGVPALGVMQLETGGRTRRVFLGPRARVVGKLACVDWTRAPLAEVFFGGDEGVEYEVEVEDRSLEGVLVSRAALDAAHRPLPTRAPPALGATARDAGPVAATGEVVLDAAQRAVVHAPAGRAELVLGAAGFGKTTVALHRVAHLLHGAAAEGRSATALVVVPTEGLRRLCERALERLGAAAEVRTYDAWAVEQARATFDGLPARLATETPAKVVRLKRHRAVRAALPKVAARPGAPPTADREDLLHLFGDRDRMAEVVQASRGSLGPGAAAQALEHTHVQFSASAEQAYAHVDVDRRRTLDGARLDAGTPWADADTFDPEDAAVLFALAAERGARGAGPRRYDVVVVDEAQSFSPLELRLLGRARKPGGDLVVAGDAAQHIGSDVGLSDWGLAKGALGAPDANEVTLTRSFRSPPAVAAIAGAIRDGARAVPVPPEGGAALARFEHRVARELSLIQWLRHFTAAVPWASVAVVFRARASAEAAASRLGRGLGLRLAVDGDFTFGPGIVVTALEEVRGLEFDLVVLPDAGPDEYPEDDAGRRALYLGLTRATRWLWVLSAGPASPLLALSARS